MIHPCCPTYIAAAFEKRGTAAALRVWSKYRHLRANCNPVTPLCLSASTRTGTSESTSVMQFIHTLSDIASARSLADTQGSFLASAYRELSVALVQSQGNVYRSCSLSPTKAAGQQVLPGAEAP
jgi:hypothetical protein